MIVSAAEQARLDVRYRTKEVVDLVPAWIGGPFDLFPRDERNGSGELVGRLRCTCFGDENLPESDGRLLITGFDQCGGSNNEGAGAQHPQHDDRPPSHDEGFNKNRASTTDAWSSESSGRRSVRAVGSVRWFYGSGRTGAARARWRPARPLLLQSGRAKTFGSDGARQLRLRTRRCPTPRR